MLIRALLCFTYVQRLIFSLQFDIAYTICKFVRNLQLLVLIIDPYRPVFFIFHVRHIEMLLELLHAKWCFRAICLNRNTSGSHRFFLSIFVWIRNLIGTVSIVRQGCGCLISVNPELDRPLNASYICRISSSCPSHKKNCCRRSRCCCFFIDCPGSIPSAPVLVFSWALLFLFFFKVPSPIIQTSFGKGYRFQIFSLIRKKAIQSWFLISVSPFFFSSPSWARTNNPSVNSRVLYHWAIEEYRRNSFPDKCYYSTIFLEKQVFFKK